MTKISDEQLLFEVEDILRTMPDVESLGSNLADVMAWIGRASAAIHAWDSIKATIGFDSHVTKLSSSNIRDYSTALRGVIIMLHQAQHDLRMKTVGPLSVGVSKGSVFEYFDEVRKVIEQAKSDVLFIDPFLDAEFVSRYLPFVAKGTSVRLLSREKIQLLIAATNIFSSQHGLEISIRGSASLHDRYVIIDSTACYQSGASFKDGAKKAGTTLTQITDAFPAVLSTYEDLWQKSTIY